ncbi:TPA: cytochrome c maturation protein CcmE [Enterobacter hormaechei subsp. steigerwaltii]|nr:cytochrome c maturation protein CcmE [Enterobacter hormaechei subsp. steigerwaltii]
MNSRRKMRLWLVLTVLTGLGITAALVLYALRTNIDLFYTPGEVLYGKRENGQKPEQGQRLRIGGMVVPGSIQRDVHSLQVNFKLYDNQGTVDVSYNGILPDLFREGQGVVAQGILKDNTHIIASEVLAKHDENYIPPEVKAAMGTPATTNGVWKENGS